MTHAIDLVAPARSRDRDAFAPLVDGEAPDGRETAAVNRFAPAG
jgi:hypothetical protein